MERPKYKIISIRKLKRVLNAIFKDLKEIKLAYLYGSYALGYQTEFSDIDIGILLNEKFRPNYLYTIELSLKIEKIFDYRINVDLRILNDATPRFLFEVIKNGMIIFMRDKDFFHEFEIKVLSEYQDIRPMLKFYDRKTISEVLGNEN
ncbi:MAG: type VII toxin-antitoxin system MntA family adenylyltransferase antitoxin [Promethearchaeota archaeon]